jgi:hypothetical protein
MTLDYQKVWSSLNELEMVTSKICSAREILDCAIDRLQEHQYDKAETLLYAADEFLQYYLAEFDTKFKDAWAETVTKVKQEENDALVAVMNEKEYYEPSMPPWGHSDMEYLSTTESSNTTSTHSSYYYDYTRNDPNHQNPFDKVIKWRLPVERKIEDGVDDYYIQFPDDLLETANLSPGDEVEWVDQNDGSFLLRKIPKTYTEMIGADSLLTKDRDSNFPGENTRVFY